MNTLAKLVNIFFGISSVSSSIPPEACFANFRWDDCGKPPVPVMYYWKPGSRCEVGMWRGCLPNPNMFPDEYTCINTCIYVHRAGPNDYEEPKADQKTTEVTESITGTDIENENNTLATTDQDSNSTATVGSSDDNGSVTTSGGADNSDSNNDNLTTDAVPESVTEEAEPSET